MRRRVLGNIFAVIFCMLVMAFATGCDLNTYFSKSAGDACFHEYNIEYFWQEYDSCKAKATCKKCGEIVEEYGTLSRSLESTNVADCLGNLEYTWTAIFENDLFEDSTKVEAKGVGPHSYIDDEIIWSKDLENREYCCLKVVCELCKDTKNFTTYDITSTTTDATCAKDGKIEYTAHFESGRTAKKSVKLTKSHSYTLQYIWNKANDKIVSCEAKDICSKCSSTSENHEISREKISVENMQKEEVEGGFRYVANFKTAGLEKQYSEVIQNKPIDTPDDPAEPENPIDQEFDYITYTATKIDEEIYEIYFENTSVFNSATCNVEGNVFRIIGCDISLDAKEDENITFCPAEECPIEFEISSQNEDKFTLKYAKKKASFIYKSYILTNNEIDYDSYIEFYSDHTACLFVNLADEIYVPFQTFAHWTKTSESTIQINYIGDLLDFNVEKI